MVTHRSQRIRFRLLWQIMDNVYFVIIGCLGIVAFLLGCDASQGLPSTSLGQAVPYEWVEKGHGVDVYEAQTRVFRDSTEWVQFWNEHVSLLDQNFRPIPPPSLDFGRRMIIAVYWGYYYTGCRVISRIEAIEGIYDAGDRIVVAIGSVPDLGLCRTMVYPTQVVSIPRVDKPVEFIGDVPEQQFEPPEASH